MITANIRRKLIPQNFNPSPLIEQEGKVETAETQRKIRTNLHNKVVCFDLPAKRIKPNSQITAFSIIESISHSVTRSDRIDAIYTASATFDHGVKHIHDEEIISFADVALCKHLSLLLLKKRNSNLSAGVMSPFSSADGGPVEEEINETMKVMEMVLRCSEDSISIAFQRIGSELIPLLLNRIQEQLEAKPEQRQEKETETEDENSQGDVASDTTEESVESGSLHSTEENDLKHNLPKSAGCQLKDSCLKTCTKIIAHFARVGSLTESLASMKGLLTTLNRVISSNDEDVTVEAKLNSLWIVANLACSAANMITMARNTELVKTIVDIASHQCNDDDENVKNVTQYMIHLRRRSIALRAILNLSWAHENKTNFSEQVKLIDTLLSAASHRTSSWGGKGNGVSGLLLQSRQHAAGALRNLAAAPRRTKRHLCRYKSGKFLEEIAKIASDPDPNVRGKIHATLWNLVSADTAKLYTAKKDVLEVIVKEALSVKKHDEHDSAGMMASRTLRLLEGTLPEDDEGYSVLRPIVCKVFESSGDADDTELALKTEAV